MTDDDLDELQGRQAFYSQASDEMLVCLTPAERDALLAEVREHRALIEKEATDG